MIKHTVIDTEKKYAKINQDVYEHLAKTFLDKKSKTKVKKKKLWIFLIIAIVISVLALFVLSHFLIKENIFSKNLFVIKDRSPLIIEYDFTTLGNAKTRAVSFNLNNIDLTDYNFFDLSIRTERKEKLDSAIKIEIENSFLEKDAQYLSGINSNWKKFSLPLNKFRLLRDWTSIKYLTFTVEDWNVSSKKDKIYIDDVRFVE